MRQVAQQNGRGTAWVVHYKPSWSSHGAPLVVQSRNYTALLKMKHGSRWDGAPMIPDNFYASTNGEA